MFSCEEGLYEVYPTSLAGADKFTRSRTESRSLCYPARGVGVCPVLVRLQCWLALVGPWFAPYPRKGRGGVGRVAELRPGFLCVSDRSRSF